MKGGFSRRTIAAFTVLLLAMQAAGFALGWFLGWLTTR